MKMIGNVSDWLSYAGGALIKVADSAGSTVLTFFLYFLIFFREDLARFEELSDIFSNENNQLASRNLLMKASAVIDRVH